MRWTARLFLFSLLALSGCGGPTATDITVAAIPGLNVAYLSMNNAKPPFDDARVREAVALALDKDRIIRAAYAGRAIAAETPVPPTLPFHHGELTPRVRDVGKARALLQEAGHTLPLRVTLSHGNNSRPYMPLPEEVAKQVAGDLEEAGFAVTIRKEEWANYLKIVQNGEHEMALLGWSADVADADNFLYVLLDKNNARVGGREQHLVLHVGGSPRAPSSRPADRRRRRAGPSLPGGAGDHPPRRAHGAARLHREDDRAPQRLRAACGGARHASPAAPRRDAGGRAPHLRARDGLREARSRRGHGWREQQGRGADLRQPDPLPARYGDHRARARHRVGAQRGRSDVDLHDPGRRDVPRRHAAATPRRSSTRSSASAIPRTRTTSKSTSTPTGWTSSASWRRSRKGRAR